MAELISQFELKLLTPSREIGLRRLRSYSASLGGGAQIFTSFEELLADAKINRMPLRFRQNIIVYDMRLTLSQDQFDLLQTLGRVFVLNHSITAQKPLAPFCVSLESYLQCSLSTFMDSLVVRTCMSQMCKPAHPMSVLNLLRWGHAGFDWRPPLNAKKKTPDISDASLDFVRRLRLGQDSRRLTEMFAHFFSTRLRSAALRQAQVESVCFRADGLVTLIALTCQTAEKNEASMDAIVKAFATDLQALAFPHILINRQAANRLEVAVAVNAQLGAPESILLLFAKARVQEKIQQQDLHMQQNMTLEGRSPQPMPATVPEANIPTTFNPKKAG